MFEAVDGGMGWVVVVSMVRVEGAGEQVCWR